MINTLDKFNFKGKTVLLRSDVNCDVKNGRVILNDRIKESAVTIKELVRKKAKVVIISHQGRVGKSDFVSLRQHAKLLSIYFKVKFVNDVIGKRAKDEIIGLGNGEVILLDNIRGVKDEFRADKGSKNNIVKFFKPIIEVYINDAFSVSHRDQASVSLIPKYIKEKGIGRLFEKELKALKKIKLKNTLFILGGAKPEDNIKLLGENCVLTTGLFGQMCFIAKGGKLGAQEKYLRTVVKDYNVVLKKLRWKVKNVETPIDFAVNDSGKRREIDVSDFPNKSEIFDIGKKTMKKYSEMINGAKSIYMKGPCGDAGDRRFIKGTSAILRAVARSNCVSLIGGGHLSDAINKSKINKKRFNHISLSGGAVVSYLSGERLVGLRVLVK